MKVMAFLLGNDEKYSRDLSKKEGRDIAPVLKLLGVLLMVVLVSLSHNAFFSYVMLAGVLTTIAMMKSDQVLGVLKIVIPVTFFTALLMLPALFLGSPRSLVLVTMKVFISVSIIAILNETSGWKEITGSLRKLHVPGVVVLAIDMTVRFMIGMGGLSNRILEAVDLRTIKKRNWKNRATGGVLGTTYLTVEKCSKETAEAMQCRCFRGKYVGYRVHKWNWRDVAFICQLVAIVTIFVYMEVIR